MFKGYKTNLGLAALFVGAVAKIVAHYTGASVPEDVQTSAAVIISCIIGWGATDKIQRGINSVTELLAELKKA